MDYQLNDDQRLLLRNIRDFARKELMPLGDELDESGRFPWESIKKMAAIGLTALLIPERYEGMDVDAISYCLILEEMGYANGPGSLVPGFSLASLPMILYGTEEQKSKYLPPMARGEKLTSFGLSEANAGSDNASMQSRAVRQGDVYVLNGSKCFNSFGSVAETYTVFAKTDPAAGHKGITAFILEKGTPGFSFGAHEKKMGLGWVPTTDLAFDDCRVPLENRLGEEGEGFKVAMSVLDPARLTVAAFHTGLSQRAFDLALEYAFQRVQFGRPIAQFQAIQFKFADMALGIEAGRQLTYSAARKKAAGQPYGREVSFAKLFTTENSNKVTYEALQIHGGYGYMKSYPMERLAREARLGTLGEGTSEIQRVIIADQIYREFKKRH
ncbi:MAG: acyl-CoA dehydrogenase [Firmicutes bacterium]|nr:acyl-CoA dehydrogenase [Bacillota bacterium]